MKKVLITGGAGFIGYHLAKKLTKENYKVEILDNFLEVLMIQPFMICQKMLS